MAPLDLVSLLTGVLGALITVWVAFVGKQLMRPRFSVEIGLSYDKHFDAPKRWLRRPIDAIAVGVTALDAQQIVLPLNVRLRNKGSLPVSDVDVVLEFPIEALVEKMGVVGPVAGKVAMLKGGWPEGRKISRLQGMAQCRIPIGILRPGETMITGEFIQLRAGLLAAITGAGATERAEVLRQRYSSCEQLRSALEVRVSVWSSSMKPVSLSIMLIWLAVKKVEELTDTLARMASLSAAAGPIKPGVYLMPPLKWGRRLHRDELVEIAMIDIEKGEDLRKVLSHDGMVENAQGAVVIRVPPWGLWGESFNIESEWGSKLLREYSD